ncbi:MULTISPECIES: CD1107 family mobile element protein [Oscillospiraceae]|uniref:CD1107 family mobile element protein n=1 Tax=Ruminococcus flavefaciens TaxID=1265 RepID=UPI0009B8E6F2
MEYSTFSERLHAQKNNSAILSGADIDKHYLNSEGEKNDKTEKNEGEGGGNNTLLILVGVLALAGGGAFYYFKVYKAKPKAPKQSLYDEDEEEYEEETVNEDTVDEEADEDEE